LELLGRLQWGTLRLITPDQCYLFGSPLMAAGKPSPLEAELKVVSDAFWLRLALQADLGFGEAFMYGEVECDDLDSLFKVRARHTADDSEHQNNQVSLN
jgi:cyclopropane-fatty-acyl-phospholipid synthase